VLRPDGESEVFIVTAETLRRRGKKRSKAESAEEAESAEGTAAARAVESSRPRRMLRPDGESEDLIITAETQRR
jgi:predicted transcriptional regulator